MTIFWAVQVFLAGVIRFQLPERIFYVIYAFDFKVIVYQHIDCKAFILAVLLEISQKIIFLKRILTQFYLFFIQEIFLGQKFSKFILLMSVFVLAFFLMIKFLGKLVLCTGCFYVHKFHFVHLHMLIIIFNKFLSILALMIILLMLKFLRLSLENILTLRYKIFDI